MLETRLFAVFNARRVRRVQTMLWGKISLSHAGIAPKRLNISSNLVYAQLRNLFRVSNFYVELSHCIS